MGSVQREGLVEVPTTEVPVQTNVVARSCSWCLDVAPTPHTWPGHPFQWSTLKGSLLPLVQLSLAAGMAVTPGIRGAICRTLVVISNC